MSKERNTMRVLKRTGETENVSFDKVLNRIKNLSNELNVDVYDVSQKVCSRIYDLVKTSELDELAAHICSSMLIEHPDYGVLASRIIVSNHHKNTSPSFSETIQALYSNVEADGTASPLISEELYQVVMKNKEKLNSYLDYTRDYNFDYFGFKTLEKAYLMKVNGRVVERPQHMFMRVAIGIHGTDFKDALNTYDMMSKKYFVHATPTLFNSGTPRPQMSSCFLLAINGDSISEIFESLQECAMISKYAGGIGIHIHDIRAKGSRIRGTNGTSDGIIPMLRVYNNTARYVNQCFTPDTTVFSKRGLLRMDQVLPGDELVTIDGMYKPVNSVSIKKVDKSILEIRTKYSLEPIKVTKEHEMYVISSQSRGLNFDVIKNRLDKGIVQPKYVAASELTTDDIVGYPIPRDVIDIAEDTDFCRFYGVMVGDGHISKKQNTNSYECGITLNMQSKKDTFTFCTQFLDTRNIKFWVSNDPIKSTVSVRWTVNMSKLAIDYDFLYKNNEKCIHPKFLSLPDKKSLALVQGLIETDGSNLKELYFHNTSKDVVMGLRYVLLRLGVLTSGYVKDDVNNSHTIVRSDGSTCEIVTRKKCYILRIPKHKNITSVVQFTPYEKVGFFEFQGMLWSRISEINSIDYSGNVYDFNMMDNHNYTVANFGLVHNSGRRNGSIAVYLEPWHADVYDFLDLKKPHGHEEERARDLFYAMWISDLFMQRVKENGVWSLMCPDVCKGLADVWGDDFKALYEKYESEGKYVKQVKAQDLWFKILESQIETGTPYLVYKDAANMKSNQKNLGTIKSSNLCVAPETMILTDKGYFPIGELKDQEVNVWNGKEFSTTVVKQTGTSQKLVTVSFDNGMKIRCTPYHKFYVDGMDGVVEANNLQSGMRIAQYLTPTINGDENLNNAYTQGVYAASSQSNDKQFTLFGDKKQLVYNMKERYDHFTTDDRVDVYLEDNAKPKYFVPVNYNLVSKIRWLEGFIDGCDGLKAVTSNIEFLKDLFYMLQTLGITSTISRVDDIHDVFGLTMDPKTLTHLKDLGFDPKSVHISDKSIGDDESIGHIVSVVDVEDNGEVADTYCFNEPKEHKGIFNGILTGQCSEILEYTSPDEIAVCNLASICLPTYVETDDQGIPRFNFEKLHEISKVVTKNLNKVIDKNFYPLQKAKVSNLKHRPIGIGVQGLADTFVLMRHAFESDEARELNRMIFETIYHGAVEESMEIAKKRHEIIKSPVKSNDTESFVEKTMYLNMNEFDPKSTSPYPGAYASFEGSPASQGQLQFDLWGVQPTPGRYDWDTLKEDIKKYGMRNSLLMAPMPTASTSQIMGYNECFEPFTSNLYKRKTMAGEFVVVNKYLIKDLMNLGLWNKDMKNKIIINEGSIQSIEEIPQHIRDLYKIVWEIKQKSLIDLAADRGAFVCQSQSMNLFVEDPDFKKLSSMHFYAWQKGLKTGCYYLRTRTKAKAQQFTIDPSLQKKQKEEAAVAAAAKKVVCTDEVCLVCSA